MNLYIIVVVLVISVCVILNNRSEKADEKRRKERAEKQRVLDQKDAAVRFGGTVLDQFFIECVLAEYFDFTKEKNVARAKMLADNYHLPYPNGIEVLFEEGRKAHALVSEQIEKDRIKRLEAGATEAEKEKFKELNRYASLRGLEKKSTMLFDQRMKLASAESALQTVQTILASSVSQQKERDWAVWGGFASGMAGTAAGVATAVGIQAQNAKIRAQNEANVRRALPTYMSMSGGIYELREKQSQIDKEREELKRKLVAETPAVQVMEKLNVTNPSLEVSDTGVSYITATVEAKEKLFIYEDVPAVADGTIIAHLWEGDKEVGIANLVLPINGVADKTGVCGMCLGGADPMKKYTITYSAENLWLMEA